VLLGSMTALCWCFTVNVWLDDSPAVLKPARIEGLRVTTYRSIIRKYIVDYSLPDIRETQEFATTPECLQTLAGRNNAVAELHAGRLGWPWVKSLRPAKR